MPETDRDYTEPLPFVPTATRKYLALGDSPELIWELVETTSLDLVEARIRAAMRSGEPITIEVRGADPSIRARLVLNGRALQSVTLSERLQS